MNRRFKQRKNRKFNNNNRNNNMNRGQHTNGQVSYIPRNPTLGKVIRKICVARDLFSIVTGTNSLVFKSNTLPSRPLGSVIGSSFDFLQMVNSYTICKIHSIRVSVVRTIGEIDFQAAGLHLNPVFTTFFPSRIFSSGLSAVDNENALVLPGLTFDVFTKTYPIIPVTSLVTSGGADYYLNPGFWIDVSLFTLIPGIFLVGWTNPTNATATTDLYSVQFFADISFASPV